MTPYQDAILRLGASLKKGLNYDVDVRHDDHCAVLTGEGRKASHNDYDPCTCKPRIVATAYVRARIQKIDGCRYAVIEQCPYCGARHLHSPEPGHRWAHCGEHPDKPPNGYILELGS